MGLLEGLLLWILLYILFCVLKIILYILKIILYIPKVILFGPEPAYEGQRRRQEQQQRQYQQQHYQQQYYQQQHYQQQHYQQQPAWPRLPVAVPQPYPPARQSPSPPAQYRSALLAQRRLSNSYPSYIDDDAEPRESAYYQQLRARARDEGDAMARAFDASKIAYQNGERARAKELSNEGKRHKAEMERLNKQASDWVFEKNNLGSAPGVIDLHGLFVKEAITKTEAAIRAAQVRGDVQIRIIVGKGLHSQGAARLRPAIEELMAKYQLSAYIDPRNAGVLVVLLGGRGESRMDPYDVMLRLQDDLDWW